MISVIVPVYNVEKYLSRCIDSILSQTFSDFELILVDDGSTDNSGIICDEYSKNHNNIKVIHKKNGGLSSARNTGTDHSKGEYITFIDSDDLIEQSYLSDLYGLIKKNNADISFCDFKFFYNESEIIQKENNYFEECVDGYSATELILYGHRHGSSACALLVKRSIAEKYKFPLGKYHEDDFVTFHFYTEAKKVAFTSKKMYYYFQRPGSIMHRPFGQAALDELEAADYIVENCKKLTESIQKASIAKQFYNYKDVLFTYSDLKQVSFETYQKVSNVLNQLKKKIINNKNVSKKIRLMALIMIICNQKKSIIISKKLGL